VNDAKEHAIGLTRLLRGIRCKINLIPYNATRETLYAPSPEKRIIDFQEILLAHNFSTFIRASKGADISAACGQLRGQALHASTK
jgi:23S rRNA (adenine2503-C2)-methyltransferase